MLFCEVGNQPTCRTTIAPRMFRLLSPSLQPTADSTPPLDSPSGGNFFPIPVRGCLQAPAVPGKLRGKFSDRKHSPRGVTVPRRDMELGTSPRKSESPQGADSLRPGPARRHARSLNTGASLHLGAGCHDRGSLARLPRFALTCRAALPWAQVYSGSVDRRCLVLADR
jgi:hypothetical protein